MPSLQLESGAVVDAPSMGTPKVRLDGAPDGAAGVPAHHRGWDQMAFRGSTLHSTCMTQGNGQHEITQDSAPPHRKPHIFHCQKWFGQLMTGEAAQPSQVWHRRCSQHFSPNLDQNPKAVPGQAGAAPSTPQATHCTRTPPTLSSRNCIYLFPFLKQRGS